MEDQPSAEVDPPSPIEFDDEVATEHVPRSKLISMMPKMPPIFSQDSLPPIPDEAPGGERARRAVGDLAPEPTPTPDLSEEEEASTGLFEPWDWDEAPPTASDQFPIKRRDEERSVGRDPVFVGGLPQSAIDTDIPEGANRPDPEDIAVPPDPAATPAPRVVFSEDDESMQETFVVDASAAIAAANRSSGPIATDEADLGPTEIAEGGSAGEDPGVGVDEFDDDSLAETVVGAHPERASAPPRDDEGDEGGRAAPAAPAPRPFSDSVVDWPPPMERPSIDYPPDWTGDQFGTKVVISPQRTLSRGWVMLVDFSAWFLGFLAMFLTGLVTTTSAALVLFALSL